MFFVGKLTVGRLVALCGVELASLGGAALGHPTPHKRGAYRVSFPTFGKHDRVTRTFTKYTRYELTCFAFCIPQTPYVLCTLCFDSESSPSTRTSVYARAVLCVDKAAKPPCARAPPRRGARERGRRRGAARRAPRRDGAAGGAAGSAARREGRGPRALAASSNPSRVEQRCRKQRASREGGVPSRTARISSHVCTVQLGLTVLVLVRQLLPHRTAPHGCRVVRACACCAMPCHETMPWPPPLANDYAPSAPDRPFLPQSAGTQLPRPTLHSTRTRLPRVSVRGARQGPSLSAGTALASAQCLFSQVWQYRKQNTRTKPPLRGSGYSPPGIVPGMPKWCGIHDTP